MWIFIVACLFITSISYVQISPAHAAQKNSTIEKLQKDLERGMEYKRMLVLEKLAQIATSEAYGLIIHTMLHDKSGPVRRAAQRLLADVSDPRIAQSIADGLNDPKRKVRLAAVDVAGLVRDPGMAEQLVETAAKNAKDTEMVLRILESLREMVYRLEPLGNFENSLYPFLKHRNRKIRETAVIILAILGRPGSLSYLMQAWERANSKLKIHLADAFANIGRVEPVGLLQQVLQQRNKPLLLHAVYALAQIQSFSSLSLIYDLLHKNKDSRVRMACLYALTEIPDPDSIPEIIKLFEIEDSTTLHWATYALSQLKAQSAEQPLLDKLAHPASLVRASAAMALGALQIKAAEPLLLRLISNTEEQPEVQIAAAKALISIGNPQGARILWQELQRPDLELESRLTYAYTLGTISDEKMEKQLAKDLKSSNFTRVISAAITLGVRGDNRARPPLITALEHGYPQIRRYAVLGLEGVLDEETYRVLSNTANDDRDPLVRILCAASLVHAGFDDFRVILWNALETRKEDQRSEAIIALGRSADAETIRQLKWYLRREPSIPVRQTIQRVLREWREKQ